MLKKVVLHLSRTADYPNGSGEHGYGVVLPLDDDGRLLPDIWEKHQDDCTVHRFWRGEEDEHGLLIQMEEGGWAFSYDPKSDYDDEPVFRLDAQTVSPGEYISVTGHDGEDRPFRVDSVRPYLEG